MGKTTGFLEYKREVPELFPVKERIKHFNDIYKPFSKRKVEKQAARCMDCGVPFCHNGCPLGNNIPDFNDMVYRENWEEAYKILISTNNFPEFTGKVCPAPCEEACVLSINKPATTIKNIELSIAEQAFANGYVVANQQTIKTGYKVAVVGSGPAGLAAAAQLNLAGHEVTVFERDSKLGGLLRYGIPDFKLEKQIIDRRIDVMKSAGVNFKTNTNVGIDISAKELNKKYDAILLAGGSTVPRDLPVDGRNTKGVHFAMEFLKQNNKRVSGEPFGEDEIHAKGKNVLVIGGGDTGSDCVGTSVRHGAKSILQIELLPKPPEKSNPKTPWPEWRDVVRTSSSHQEGCERQWSVLTKEFIKNDKGELKAVKLVDIEWDYSSGKPQFKELTDTERIIDCDLALLAIGFVSPQHEGLLNDLKVELDERKNVKADSFKTTVDKVFTAGDMHTGQSLVVRAISEGREAAYSIDVFLTGSSVLESKTHSLISIV